MVLEFFIMQMAQNMKVNGGIILRMALQFLRKKMEQLCEADSNKINSFKKNKAPLKLNCS